MIRLVGDDYTVDEYIGHLSALLGFYDPFETALAEAAVGAVPTPRRSTLLADDLRSLGLTTDQIQALPRCGGLPSIAGPGMLGALYVYEGSALGGQIVARRLRRSLGATRRFAFYHADAARTQAQWTDFCTRLDADQTANTDAICETALAVFGAFGNWFERESGDITGVSI